MFENPRNRAIARAVLGGLIAAAATLKTTIADGLTPAEIVDVVTTGVIGFGAWIGLGAATPLEPSIGRKP